MRYSSIENDTFIWKFVQKKGIYAVLEGWGNDGKESITSTVGLRILPLPPP